MRFLSCFFIVSIVGLGSFTLPIVSIIGGFIALLVVFGLVRLSSRSLAIETIILAGIIVSAFISAVVSLLISLGDRDAMTQIIYWLYGSVGMRGWNYVELIFPFMIIGACILFYHHRELNAMALGEEAADHIGVNVKKGKTIHSDWCLPFNWSICRCFRVYRLCWACDSTPSPTGHGSESSPCPSVIHANGWIFSHFS